MIAALKTAGANDPIVLAAIEVWKKGWYGERYEEPTPGRPTPTATPEEFPELESGLRRWTGKHDRPTWEHLHRFHETTRQFASVSQYPDREWSWRPTLAEVEEQGALADGALNDLKDRLWREAEPPTPWSDSPGWEELQGVPRRLLEYMHDRKETLIDDDLCRHVWHKGSDQVSKSAIGTALSRANAFLGAHGTRRVLSKVRDEPVLRWQ
jgi:hypothetical protein